MENDKKDNNEISKNISDTMQEISKVISRTTENIEEPMQEISKAISIMIENINVNIPKDILKDFKEITQNIPKYVSETRFFKDIQALETKKDLKYEEIEWLLTSFGADKFDIVISDLVNKIDTSDKLHGYIKSIILNKNIEKREKTVILLTHMEALIYNTLSYLKQPGDKIKLKVKWLWNGGNKELSATNIGWLYVMGITYVVFSNTDRYKDDIDKRIPFRNNILHKGIVSYTCKDIEAVYSLLVSYIYMLLDIKMVITTD